MVTHSHIQAVIFKRNGYWNPTKARKWLAKHGMHAIKRVHTTEQFYRYRLMNPNDFKRMRTKKEPHDIELIIGFK